MHLRGFCEKDKEMKQRQKEMYDWHHRVHSVPTLPDDTSVWVNTQGHQVPGRVVTTAGTPYSYVVKIPSGGRVRRNPTALSTHAENTTTSTIDPVNNTACRRTTWSQAGIPIWPPDQLTYWRKGDVVWTPTSELLRNAWPLGLSMHDPLVITIAWTMQYL